jgi:hypothetical protein
LTKKTLVLHTYGYYFNKTHIQVWRFGKIEKPVVKQLVFFVVERIELSNLNEFINDFLSVVEFRVVINLNI